MILRHTKEYLWALAMAAGSSYAFWQAHYVSAVFFAYGSGYCLNEGFHLTRAYYLREIDRLTRESLRGER